MSTKMTKEMVVSWIESTVKEIKALLENEGIPYKDSWIDDEYSFYTHQLLFPWHEGDVVIGTLHPIDNFVINGHVRIRRPSIETYQFPWDHGDVSLFPDPESFVHKLKELYVDYKEENNNE